MAGSSRRWESDPLFSAAEVVQDSADRLALRPPPRFHLFIFSRAFDDEFELRFWFMVVIFSGYFWGVTELNEVLAHGFRNDHNFYSWVYAVFFIPMN